MLNDLDTKNGFFPTNAHSSPRLLGLGPGTAIGLAGVRMEIENAIREAECRLHYPVWSAAVPFFGSTRKGPPTLHFLSAPTAGGSMR
jgi:hypothetical protein